MDWYQFLKNPNFAPALEGGFINKKKMMKGEKNLVKNK